MEPSDRRCGCSKSPDSISAPGIETRQERCQSASKPASSGVLDRKFVTGIVRTPAGEIPQVSTRLSTLDYLGAMRARWGIRRDQYRVNPGLYAIGTPDERSDVLVTANYKLTFDTVRRNLAGLNVWLMVLDTRGINVWCAAGKGTFGTEEVVRRIRATSLEKVVLHRRLILPQLGATGVAAHLVKKASGFAVLFGPVRATDIQSFIRADHKATKPMRLVTFGWFDRLVVTPNDFLFGIRYLIAVVLAYALLSSITRSGLSLEGGIRQAPMAAVNIGLSYFAGIVLTPLLLPFIPIRMFAFKGYVVGLVLTGILAVSGMLSDIG